MTAGDFTGDEAFDQLEAPLLGTFVRSRRTRPRTMHRRGFSRPELAAAAGVSASYLTALEHGEKRSPSPEVIHALARVLELSPVELQHLQHLAGPATAGPRTNDPMTIDEMRALLDDDVDQVLGGMSPHLSCFLDERWNVLAANTEYSRAYPGLLEVVNVLVWFFTVPESRRVMLEWEAEAQLTVNWFRWHMAGYANPQWALDLLQRLSPDPQFRRMWTAEEVDFKRHQPLMHLRDPDTGESYSLRVTITNVPGIDAPLQWFVGHRIKFSGPPALLGAP